MKKTYWFHNGSIAGLGLGLSLALGLNACSPPQNKTVLDRPTSQVEVASPKGAIPIENGVALTLAQSRKARISELSYNLDFTITSDKNADIKAIERVEFSLSDTENDLLLDFRESAELIRFVSVNGTATPVNHAHEHLIIPEALLKLGRNTIDIDFIAGNTSLNRNPEFLYTLFVPDRARTVFPLFDQPNLKARYNLALTIPDTWQALGNAPAATIKDNSGTKQYIFETSDLISSYLFSFVAGEFKTVTREINGREMTMLHRETDADKFARNVDDLFR